MRAGYDRVYADVRRPMIPDLPVPPKRQPEEIPDESGKALAVILAVLVFLLFFCHRGWLLHGAYASDANRGVAPLGLRYDAGWRQRPEQRSHLPQQSKQNTLGRVEKRGSFGCAAVSHIPAPNPTFSW